LITELSKRPYGPLAALKFPQIFMKNNILESTLIDITHEEISEYIQANPDNLELL
jgi:hypothetical protein